MTAAPWLSVIMPAHHGERWIAEALGSLRDAGAEGVECLVLDSSEDNATTAAAAAFLGELDLRLLRRPDQRSWQAKTNEGALLARAPHLCMLHQDDLWLTGRTAALRRAIATAPEAVLQISPARIVDSRGRLIGTWRCPLEPGAAPAQELHGRLLVQNFVAIPAPLIRRADFLAVGGLDETLWYTADWDLYLKLAARGEVTYTPEPHTAFRVHGGSLTVSGSRALSDMEQQLRIVLERHIGTLRGPALGRVRPLAEASIAVNVALAGAFHGERWRLVQACWRLLRLGPFGFARYLRDSRLLERVLPRLRAGFAKARVA